MTKNPTQAGQRQLSTLMYVATALLFLITVSLIPSCGGGAIGTPPSAPVATNVETLTTADVNAIVLASAQSVDTPIVIAVTDRGGAVLAVYKRPGAPATSIGNFSQSVPTDDLAVALARTASYFSNDEAPLSSRTVRFISGVHFPPGISFTLNGDLYGIENTNRGCPLNVTYLPGQAITPSRTLSNGTGLGIITGKVDILDSDPFAANSGGVPLFKNGILVGGVGVAGGSDAVNEFAAFSGVAGAGFAPQPAPPGVVVIAGITLPFVNQTTIPTGVNPGMNNGTFTIGPLASAGPVPDGDLIAIKSGPLGGLTTTQVQGILDAAVATANTTRSVIRLPDGQRARFAIAVADLDGTIIGLRRMSDTTVFSIDVAVAKARNLVYLSGPAANPLDLGGMPVGTALTNRTVSFGAQPMFPAGIDGSDSGPFFGLYQYDLANPCTNAHQPPNPNQNGIVFFPGSVPLYTNGVLVGALGVSGDGVDEDDYVSGMAATGYEAPTSIRADQFVIRGVRMPYLKYPRNPTL